MELILWRHAEAEDGIPDSARALTPKGRKQAKHMAAWLRPRLPENVEILVSPTLRTQQTAAALERDFSTLDALAPGAAAHDILAAAHWPDGPACVVVVGHQPTLGEVASLLLAGSEAGFSIRKGALWWLEGRARGAGSECVLRAVLAPDLA